MANRRILHRNRLESFKEYLMSKGWTIQDTKGLYEVLRAVNKEVTKRPLIIYDGKSKEHLSVDDRDFWIVKDFLNNRKIELVIKIPEEDFERCKENYQRRIDIMGEAIANGIPLPKGHGRLIDADKLEYIKNDRPDEIGYHYIRKYNIDYAPTIIEADVPESEDE